MSKRMRDGHAEILAKVNTIGKPTPKPEPAKADAPEGETAAELAAQIEKEIAALREE